MDTGTDDFLTLLEGDAVENLRTLETGSVQCVVTSPPFWGLRDYGNSGQIGLEKTPEEYVAKMVEVFREVRRVLRKDGTLWLNLGDSFVGGNNTNQGGNANFGSQPGRDGMGETAKAQWKGLPAKNLVGIPWRVAFALQADGWWLRSDIIWAKPNPMPESVTDRPTKSHEYLFLLTKSANYFYDAEAIKERSTYCEIDNRPSALERGRMYDYDSKEKALGRVRLRPNGLSQVENKTNPLGYDNSCGADGSRNKRSVWTVATAPYPEAHFATYPPDLIKPCIMAGSRVGDTILDPFGGSGTTGMVALELGRKAVLIELNTEYCKLIEKRCTVTLGLSLTA